MIDCKDIAASKTGFTTLKGLSRAINLSNVKVNFILMLIVVDALSILLVWEDTRKI